MNRALEVVGVSRVIDGEVHLADVNLSFALGSTNVLLGRTRAGKTSLLRVLAGLDRPTRGTLRWKGDDVTGRDVRTRDVAMVYQQFVNYPSLTVYENIASPLRRAKRRVDPAELDRRVRETAARLRIEAYLDRLPAELSGGQQQRTAIARALAKRAGLLLLDEPLANLDYKLREDLRSELRTLFRDEGAVVVYATAEPSEALLLGGTTVVLDEGRVLQQGAALEVYRAPRSVRVGQVTSDPEMSLLAAGAEDGTLRLPDGTVVRREGSLSAGRYRLGVRAHTVRLAARGERDLRLDGNVEGQELSGSETFLHVRVGEDRLVAQLPSAARHALGEPISLFLDPEQLFVFDASGGLVAPPSDRVGDGAH